MINGSSLFNRGVLRRGALLLILVSLAACQGACIGPCGGVPVVFLPLVLPPALIASAVNSQYKPDFIVVGQVLDDRGELVHDVDAQITAWTAKHRRDGSADQWKPMEERETLGPAVYLAEETAQALEIVLRHPGYRDRRIVITRGPETPPTAQIRGDTQIRSEGTIDIRDLEGGGTLYSSHDDRQRLRMSDLAIVMERTRGMTLND